MRKKKSFRMRRATKLRKKLKALGVVRLVVHRTPRHIYAQIVNQNSSKVLVSAATVEKEISKELKYTGNSAASAVIGKIIAERSLVKGIKNISFDRSGFKYHGRIRSLADAARKAGLQF